MRCSIPVVITLTWIFIASSMFGIPYLFIFRTINEYTKKDFLIQNAIEACVFCVYPLGGCLADVKFGRYKIVLTSMHVLLLLSSILILISIPWMILQYYYEFAVIVFQYFKGLWCLCLIPIAVFHANVIPFGMDQLQDSPSDHQSLFIHWYVFAWYSGFLLSETILHFFGLYPDGPYTFSDSRNRATYNVLIYAVPLGYIISLLAASLWLASRKKQQFFVDSARPSPYRLVYMVTKFAWKHKVPVRRSAFTYCEDEIPTGLDLGKTKYGGPFTTEEVEDVKAFYGILKVLFAAGPIFLLYIAADRLLINFYLHTSSLTNEISRVFIGWGILTPGLIVIGIPVYVIFLHPLITDYIPGMLKRMGLGIFLIIVTLVFILILDTIAHAPHENFSSCMFSFSRNISFRIELNSSYIIIPRVLNCVSKMLISIALYEFICSQSPHTLKGMLIGMSFALKGIFELLGIVAVILFETLYKDSHHISCGMQYYLMNIVAGLLVFIFYVYVTHSYHYRLRDEPCHVYRYAEEYYSRIPDHT